MLKIVSQKVIKLAQGSFVDELRDIDWGEDEDFESPWDKYLVDEIEKPEEKEISEVEETELPTPPMEIPPEEDLITLPDGETLEPEGEYMNVQELLTNSMDDPPHLIKFDYTTRYGIYTANRIVEPHRIYTAMTGNDILLTYDRSIGGDIRGFIVGNIKPFGVLYKNTFVRKPEIMKERTTRPLRPVTKRR